MFQIGFDAYQVARELHVRCEALEVRGYLRSQLSRASSSVVLNLSEGRGRTSAADRRHFYSIALGSLRETQAILDITLDASIETKQLADRVGAMVYRLCHPSPS